MLLASWQVDAVYVTLDRNNDQIVSSREFKEWLLAKPEAKASEILLPVIELLQEKFSGDVGVMFSTLDRFVNEFLYGIA